MEQLVMLLIVTLLLEGSHLCHGSEDNFDQIKNVMSDMTDCKTISKSKLLLAQEAVSHLPMLNHIHHSNRSALRHMHNMALNRALFYSFIMQRLNASHSFMYLPDWNYMSASTTADIHANVGIFNASAIYYDQNKHYPNWINTVEFNQTIPFLGPKAYHSNIIDDTREPRSGVVMDIGSGSKKNYTSSTYKMNPWYDFWIPDDPPKIKDTFRVKIKYSSETGAFLSSDFDEILFYGPVLPNEWNDDIPVMFTRPYFDCGSSDKWVVSAVSPVVDFLPRYTPWQHIRGPRFVGVAVMDIDFQQIDINPCPISLGNPEPNYFAGIDECEKNTTQCKPLSGYGFNRYGYVCECKPGYHFPSSVQGPYNSSEYRKSMDEHEKSTPVCVVTENLVDKDNQTSNETSSSTRKRRSAWHVSDIVGSVFEIMADRGSRTKRSINFNQTSYLKVKNLFKKITSIDGNNCGGYAKADLILPREYSYRLDQQFDNQARYAVRLAHLLSNHHQNFIQGEKILEIFTSNRIHFDSVFGEVIANVMSDKYVLSSGVFYEQNQFENHDDSRRVFFGPMAFSRQGEYYAIDMAGFQTRYTEEHWYKSVSSKWRNDTSGLKKYKVESFIRSDSFGTNTVKHPHFPMEYFAPSVEQGVWSDPYFRCDGQIDDWVVTYSVPFVGLDDAGKNLMFKGVATVDVPLKELDVNQCPQPSSSLNEFKNTALCDYISTDCIPLEGQAFRSGGYKCVCKKGYEYPWDDGLSWYDGIEIEKEYEMKISGNSSNIFEELKCRKIPMPTRPPVTTQGPISLATFTTPIPVLVVIAVYLTLKIHTFIS